MKQFVCTNCGGNSVEILHISCTETFKPFSKEGTKIECKGFEVGAEKNEKRFFCATCGSRLSAKSEKDLIHLMIPVCKKAIAR